jgi:hypothetical protein
MERPTGVTILAVLAFIGAGTWFLLALVALFGGALLSHLSSSGLGMMTTIGGVVVAVFFLGFAALCLVIGLGFWKLKNWARVLTIVLLGISIFGFILALLNPFIAHLHVFFFLFLIRRLIVTAIQVWIIVYLLKPHVKQAFGAAGF